MMAGTREDAPVDPSEDPELRFHNAREVVESALDREAKIAILRQWALDLRERMVAEEENMSSAEEPGVELGNVLRALDELGAEKHPEEAAPNKLASRADD